MLDFFGISLGTEPWHAERIFFLKDPQAVNAVAFSCLPGMSHGIAGVNAIVRHTGVDLRFVPIDFNPLYVAHTPRSQLRCDGMLHSQSRETVVFVEMKNRSLVPRNVSRWTTKGVSQLAAVVKQFKQCNPGEDSLVNGEHAAYVCNQQSPYVVEYASTNDKMSFLMDPDTWGFLLYIKKLIVIENAK